VIANPETEVNVIESPDTVNVPVSISISPWKVSVDVYWPAAVSTKEPVKIGGSKETVAPLEVTDNDCKVYVPASVLGLKGLSPPHAQSRNSKLMAAYFKGLVKKHHLVENKGGMGILGHRGQ